VLWRWFMWLAHHRVGVSLQWFDRAQRAAKRCRDAGGPSKTGVLVNGGDPEP
jgi:hypothetical protein